ncbi:MAG TPA: hypothetical protein VKH43_06030 [Thermoanaerobaculia bacterium]|nr:hypothetical protein [Thermoanaerobaculia bacterium]
MRPRRVSLAVSGLFLLAAAASVVAQQQPIHGCNAAPSCRPLGYSTLDKNAGFGGFFFGVGARFGPGFNVFVPGVKEIPVLAPPAPPTGEIFHLGASLLNPLPTPALFPPPSTTPAPDR